MIIKLKDILQNRSYPDAGAELLNYIESGVDSTEKFIIDMSEVSAIPTMFMNMSFAVIIDKYGIVRAKTMLSFANISKLQIERIKKYFKDYEELIAKQ
ncbi:MAG: STAS-like domain-containing protein [Bacteroidales bacterium]|nr:STAS-like domain-containing protein [Bacteroidales bacterium]